MKREDAFKLLEKACRYLSRFASIRLDSKRSIKDADSDYEYGKFIVNAGSKEFFENPGSEFNDSVVVISIVALFHEVYGHGGQQMLEFGKSDPLSKVLALNHYACKASPWYYGFADGYAQSIPTGQYFRQPHEIAAQYMGIKTAWKFLSEQCGSKEATQMILSYVDHRVKHDSEFIQKKGQESVEDVLSDFNRAFKRNVFRKRDYPDHKGVDALTIYAGEKGSIAPIKKIWSMHDGIRQDYMMASALFHVKKSVMRMKNLPVFSGMDLNVDTVFRNNKLISHPRPEGSDLDLSRLQVLAEELEKKEKDSDDLEY